MTLTQFDNGYWYATELKEFAETIGIPSAGKLRKDELEKAIKLFLKSGKAKNPAKRNLSMSGIKDIEKRFAPRSSGGALYERQGDQGFPRTRGSEARSGLEEEI